MLALRQSERMRTPRCGLVNRAASRTDAARDVAGMAGLAELGAKSRKKPQQLWITQ
jgi:hypothetical protein